MTRDVRPLVRLLSLNTDLLLNATDGLSDEEAVRRVLPPANSVAFIVAHLVDMRHFLAALAGSPTPNPVASLLESARSIDDIASWPPIADLRGWWAAAGAHVTALLPELGDEQLAARLERPLPGGDPSLFGGIAFAVQHESYHLGPISLLRRGLGHPAMSYRRRSAPAT